MKILHFFVIPLLATLAIPFAAEASTGRAYCKYFPNGAFEPTVSMGCTFSMSQGFITLRWDDGVISRFNLIRGRSMTYTDDLGGIVYQQRDEDANGKSIRIMKMENGSIHIWGS